MNIKHRTTIASLVILLIATASVVHAQQLAFPTAEGFGRFATGGRGGAVCKVTNLNDSGAGSLRACLGQSGPRTILFAVSGIITLTTAITSIPADVTIACHSAPGQGILIKGSLKFWDTENVIMRYCRIRPPSPTDTTWAVAVSVTGPYSVASNLIFDHLSVGWVYDDMLGLTFFDAPPSQPLNATVQWSIFSESVNSPGGVAAGSKGATSGAVFNPTGVLNASWLYNLYSNVGKRTPHPGSGTRHQVVNQVLHNLYSSSFESIYILARYQPTIANIVGNWFRSTGASTWGVGILGCGWPGYTCNSAAELASNIYIHGNLDTLKRPNTATGNELDVARLNNASNFTIQSTTPNSGFPNLPSQKTAELAFPMVMANVGAHKPFRDAIDQRAIADATNDVRRGACPVNPGAICFAYPTYTTGTVPLDTDGDGIPNTWETAHGLNPNLLSDGSVIALNGWSNLENYLHELAGEAVAPPTIPPPVALQLSHTCSTPSNVLGARVQGTLLYLVAGANTTTDALSKSACASSVTITDSASILPSGRAGIAPWAFLGTVGPNVGNLCENCLSVHGGTLSVNAPGSGYTLTDFQEATSVSGATGGTSAFTVLPALCNQVVDGVVTSNKLWPWPTEARIAQARSQASRPPVNVTLAVEAMLGPIPAGCYAPPPGPPQTTWAITTNGIDSAMRACSQEEPCATFAHVAPRMSSGHRLNVGGGTYAQRITPGMFPPGASQDALTTISAYASEVVTLQMSSGNIIEFNDSATDRHILLSGLRVDGQSPSSSDTRGLVVSNGAGPIRFQDGIITNTARERVFLDSTQGVELVRTTVSGGKPTPTYAAIYAQGSTHGLLLQELFIEGSPTHAIQIFGPGQTQARITRNTIRGNLGTAILLDTTLGVQLDNNVVTGNATGIHIIGDSRSNLVTNNTIADNNGTAVELGEGTLDNEVRNTIMWGNTRALVDGGTNIATPNLTTDPGFVGGGNYQITNSDSPAVDAGATLPTGSIARDGTMRPLGAGWDIGAYEIAGTPPAPSPIQPSPIAIGQFLLP